MADINSNLPVNDTADGTIGAAAPTIATQVGGTDGTNLRAISTDTSGKVKIDLNDGAGTSVTVGQKAMASSLPVAIASDQTVIPVGGNVADGAADTGNTVKVGGVYDSTLPVYANGQRGHLELDANGRLLVRTAAFSYRQIAGVATITVKSGAGYLNSVVINAASASTGVTIYDNTAASGTIIAIASGPAAGSVLLYQVAFTTGITIVTANANTNITVTYT